jgi:group I intron endonuclease
MGIYSIYRVTNIINNKVYIGFTSNLNVRIQTHKSRLHLYNFKFYAAIKKYGWDNFIWEEIYQSKDLSHTKNIMEPYFIEYYNSYHKGYNSTLGGDGGCGRLCSNETRIKLSGTLEEKWGNDRASEIKQILIKKHPANNSNSRDSWLTSLKKNHASKTGKQNLPTKEKHHNYDHALYTLQNINTLEILTITQHDFLNKINAKGSGNFSQMIRGKRKSCWGWRLISVQN